MNRRQRRKRKGTNARSAFSAPHSSPALVNRLFVLPGGRERITIPSGHAFLSSFTTRDFPRSTFHIPPFTLFPVLSVGQNSLMATAFPPSQNCFKPSPYNRPVAYGRYSAKHLERLGNIERRRQIQFGKMLKITGFGRTQIEHVEQGLLARSHQRSLCPDRLESEIEGRIQMMYGNDSRRRFPSAVSGRGYGIDHEWHLGNHSMPVQGALQRNIARQRCRQRAGNPQGLNSVGECP